MPWPAAAYSRPSGLPLSRAHNPNEPPPNVPESAMEFKGAQSRGANPEELTQRNPPRGAPKPPAADKRASMTSIKIASALISAGLNVSTQACCFALRHRKLQLAGQGCICSGIAIANVVVRTAIERVSTCATDQDVITLFTAQHIIALAAV